jgi:hypothetical protein
MVIQLVSLLLFCVLLWFWFIVTVKTMSNLAEGGLTEAQRWYFRIMLRPDEMFPNSMPGWDTVALRFGGLAIVTVMLWLACRKLIGQIINFVFSRAGTPR